MKKLSILSLSLTIFLIGVLIVSTISIIDGLAKFSENELHVVVGNSYKRVGTSFKRAAGGKWVDHIIEAYDEKLCGSNIWPNNDNRQKGTAKPRSNLGQPTKQTSSKGTQLRMTNGTRAGEKQFPSYVLLKSSYMREDFEGVGTAREGFCGGILVARDIVLTAAHCVASSLKFDNIRVYAGLTDMTKQIKTEKVGQGEKTRKLYNKEIQIANVYGYCLDRSYNNTPPGCNDLAVLQLDRKFEFDEYVQPVCLQFDQAPQPDDLFYGPGFGRLADETRFAYSDNLNYHKMKQLNYTPKNCPTNILHKTSDKIGKMCLPDAGGGLYMFIDNKQYLAGILSAVQIDDSITKNGTKVISYCLPGHHAVNWYHDIFKNQIELKRLLKYCYEQI